jgi:Methyltransferase domain
VCDEFLDYVLTQLPESPARVLEVGCGEAGGVAPALAERGYDVLAIDPDAPTGQIYRRTTLEELDESGPFGAAIAGRVLHHVNPLGPALDKLARLAPLLVVDEFASDRIDGAAREWYAAEYAAMAVDGVVPHAPRDLDEWRVAHAGLHPYSHVRAELDLRYEVRDMRWLPYLHRWLRNPAMKAREQLMIDTGALQPIGFRYTGVARPTPGSGRGESRSA